MSPSIDINVVPCGDVSHNAVTSNIDLEMGIRAKCKIPKPGKQVNHGRYWTLQTAHQIGAAEPGALNAFHQAAVDAWQKGLYPRATGVKGKFGVMSVKDSSDFIDWEIVEKKDADEDHEVKSTGGKHVHCFQTGLQ